MDDAARSLLGREREPHFSGRETEIGAGVLLQGPGLGVSEPLRHVLDGEPRVLQQAVGVEHARRGEKVPRAGQAGAGEPTRARAAIDARPRRHLLDRLNLPGRAQRFLQHPTQLLGQRRERLGELTQHPARGRVHLLVRDHLAQPLGMVVEPAEYHVADAALAQRQGRVENERE